MRGLACVRDLFGDLFTRAETRIQKSTSFEPVQRRRIIGEMFGLTTHRAVPGKTEPDEVLFNGVFVFDAATCRVDILDPQHETAAARACRLECVERREGMTKMQKSRRAWGEAGDNHGAELYPCAAGTIVAAIALRFLIAL